MTTAEPPAAPEPLPTSPPRHWEADVLLRDGRAAHVRPIRDEDEQLMVEFYARVSDQSKYYRFFSPMPQLSERDLHRFTHVDHVERVALVMLLGGRMIAVGRFEVTKPGEADVAFLVDGGQVVREVDLGSGQARDTVRTTLLPAQALREARPGEARLRALLAP